MAQSGPFAPSDLHAFVRTCGYLLTAGKAAMLAGAPGLELGPRDRWRRIDVLAMIDDLPPAARRTFTSAGGLEERSSLVREHQHLLGEAGIELSLARTLELLDTGAALIERPRLALFTDEEGLLAVEQLTRFVNSYAMGAPRRVPELTTPDPHNRRFRAFQRRLHGIGVPVYGPSVIIGQEPPSTHELLDFVDQALTNDARSIRRTAMAIAARAGRPMDATAVDQLTLAMVVAWAWRGISAFPEDPCTHPLLGARPNDGAQAARWDVALRLAQMAVASLARPRPHTSDPNLVHAPSLVPVAGIALDGPSLHSLHRFHQYVEAHDAWIASHGHDDFRGFHLHYTGSDTDRASKPQLIANLADGARDVIADVNALLARSRPISTVARSLAAALGDRTMEAALERTLRTAVEWLKGPDGTVAIDLTSSTVPEAVAAFSQASPRDAEALLDLGAAVVELVRFGSTLSADGRAPAGWWRGLHTRTNAGSLPSSMDLLGRLPPGARSLIQEHRALLATPTRQDFVHAPRALASALGRLHEQPCIRTLAIALAVGVAWAQLEGSAEAAPTDTLMGADGTSETERYLLTRAKAQLDWGLQELLHTDSIIGV